MLKWTIKMSIIANKNITLTFHEGTYGPSHDLQEHLLKNNVKRLLFIAHPLLFLPENAKNPSRYELYENGSVIASGTAYLWKLPEPMLYIKDFAYSIVWSLKFNPKADLFIGLGNLNALAGYILKLLGKTRKVIYYVIDYVPNRFENKLLNSLYHFIERICAEKCDSTWNLSPRMVRARKQRWEKEFPNQLVVPHGVHFKRIKRIGFDKKNKDEIIYMGSILKKQGIQLVIKSLPQVIKHIPNLKFVLIGKGPYKKELEKLVNKLELQEHVKFLGYIKDHKEVENRITKAVIAVVLYTRKYDPNDFTYYADPGKVKIYLGAGVPVIITDVPFVARQIQKAKCGFIVKYKKEDLARTLISYLLDKKLMETYRKNALKFAIKYEWDSLFEKAFSQIK